MRRWLASFAKIARRGYQPAAEMILPDAVYHHARGQRIFRVRDPVGKLQPPARRRSSRQCLAAQNLRKTPRHFLACVLWIAPQQHMRIVRLPLRHGIRFIQHRHAHRDRQAPCLEFFDLRLNLHQRPAFGRVALGVECLPLVIQPLQLGIDGRQLICPRLQDRVRFGLRDAQDHVLLVLDVLRARERIARAVENSKKRVVVLGGNRIVLVIVTARAAHAQAQHGLAEVIDGVIDREVHVLLRHDAETLGNRQVAGGHGVAPALGIVLVRQQIPGDLLAQKLVVRLVAIEGINHVVAIEVSLRHRVIRAVAGAIGIAHHIQPMPPPTLAVARRRQQPIDHSRISF